MRKILFIILLSISLFGSEEEISFWDNVKDSSDIELLQLYKKKYPNGAFESIADIKIKRLQKANRIESSSVIPNWINGTTVEYKYYGVGDATKHFKGEEYQHSLAYKRAERKLVAKINGSSLNKFKQEELLSKIQEKLYTDDKQRVYILLYIDNYDI